MASKFDVTAGRQYLARLASMGEFRPTMPIANYKPGYVRTLVTGFQAQERAGAPYSRQAARRHVRTPEHPGGRAPRLPAQASVYRPGKPGQSRPARKPLRVHNRPQNSPSRQDFPDGSIATTHQTAREALAMLRFYADQDVRVIVAGYDCDLRRYRSIGVNAGHIRGWNVNNLLDDYREFGGTFTDWFLYMANSTDSDPDQAALNIGHVCFWQIFAFPVDRHLSARRFAR